MDWCAWASRKLIANQLNLVLTVVQSFFKEESVKNVLCLLLYKDLISYVIGPFLSY